MKYSAIFLSCLNFAPKKGLLTAQFARYSTIVGYHWKITKFFRSFAKLRVDISTFCNLKETVNTHSYHLQIPLHPDPIDLYSAVADVYLTVYLRGHPFPAGPNAGVRPSQQQPCSEWVQSYRFGSPLVIFIFWSESATGWYWGIGYELPGYWPTV
jgi:hypothetical protein